MSLLSHGETPYVYDFWSAMWVLSSILDRSIYVPRPYAPVFLNTYIMFISDSGVTRKSTTISAARGAYTRFRDTVTPNYTTEMVEAKETPGSLEWRFAKQCENGNDSSHVTICVSELMRFLGRGNGAANMPGLLTDLYDCPATRTGGSLSDGQYEYSNVYCTLLAGSTPRWLEKYVNPAVVEGGFTSRTLFITAEQRKQLSPWADSVTLSYDGIDKTLEMCYNNSIHTTEIPLTPNARNEYIWWYKRLQKEPQRSVYVESFVARQPDHVLRCAALLCINDGSLRIDVHHFRAAVRLIQEAKVMGARLFGGGRFVSDTVKAINKLTEVLLLNANVGTKQSDLWQKVRHLMTKQEFHDIIDTMIETKMIIGGEAPSISGVGRPAMYYIPTNKIRNAAARDQLIDELSGEQL